MKPKPPPPPGPPPPRLGIPETGHHSYDPPYYEADEDPQAVYRGVLIGLAISAGGLAAVFVVLVLLLVFS